MKTTLPLLLLTCSLVAAPTLDKAQVVTLTLVNPTGLRWLVEKGEEPVWLSGVPHKTFQDQVAKLKTHNAMKARLDAMIAEETALHRELDHLAEQFTTASSDGMQAIAHRRAKIRTRLNELRRQAEAHLKQFNEFLGKNGGGEAVARPKIRVLAAPTGRKVSGREEWRYLGPAPTVRAKDTQVE
jgi:hypothetical protein